MNATVSRPSVQWWHEPAPLAGAAAALLFFRRFTGERTTGRKFLLAIVLMLVTVVDGSAQSMKAEPASLTSIVGTWTLDFADVIHANGSRSSDYGANPKGVMQIDPSGRYTIFIFDRSRPKFASGDKKSGTDAELRAAVLGTSSHYGTLSVDAIKHTLEFHIEGSTYPNWEGTTQQRHFQIEGNLLTYRVPSRPNGDTPTTGWKRAADDGMSHAAIE